MQLVKKHMSIKNSSWPSFSNEESNKVKKILLSNKVNYWTGEECRKFEKEFAKFSDTKYAVSLTNGTVALDLALKVLGIGVGDEVIVTSRSFIASVSCIVNAGAIPVFADVCENSQNITTSNVKTLITSKTKAIICVHLAGFPCEMKNINKLASSNNLYVIEDCAQAHGARYMGKSVGSFGHIGCWSFCQDKIISTGGEGGMVTTNNKKLWEKMWSYKDHGKSYKKIYNHNNVSGFKWLHDSFGTNWRMMEFQAAIGRIQLKKINEWTKKRNHNQNTIWSICNKFDALRVPEFNKKSWKGYHKDNIHAAYKCYVFVEPSKLKKGWSRNKIIEEISKNGVKCFSGSCSEIYLEKAFKKTDFTPKERLKVAKKLGETSLMFLIHPTLTKKELKLTCDSISSIMKLASK